MNAFWKLTSPFQVFFFTTELQMQCFAFWIEKNYDPKLKMHVQFLPLIVIKYYWSHYTKTVHIIRRLIESFGYCHHFYVGSEVILLSEGHCIFKKLQRHEMAKQLKKWRNSKDFREVVFHFSHSYSDVVINDLQSNNTASHGRYRSCECWAKNWEMFLKLCWIFRNSKIS